MTTQPNNEAERAAFEAWAGSQGYDTSSETFGDSEPEYIESETWALWGCWLARSALSVASPIGGSEAPRVEPPDDGELEAWRHSADALLAHAVPATYEIRRAALLLQNAYLFARALRAAPLSAPIGEGETK
jgi:hypothetical protein